MDFQSRDRCRHAVEELADPTGEAQVREPAGGQSAREAAGREPTAGRPTSATT